MSRERRTTKTETTKRVQFADLPGSRVSTFSSPPSRSHSQERFEESAAARDIPSVQAIIEAYELGKQFGSSRNNVFSERSEGRRQQSRPRSEIRRPSPDASVLRRRSADAHSRRSRSRPRSRSRSPDDDPFPLEAADDESLERNEERDRRFARADNAFDLGRPGEDIEYLEIPHSYDYELPSQYFSSDTRDSSVDGAGQLLKHTSSKPMDGVTITAITKARWVAPESGEVSVSLEAALKSSAVTDCVWIHIQKPYNTFAYLRDVIRSLSFLPDETRDKAQAFVRKTQQDHEHYSESGCALDPSALFCSSNKSNKGAVLHFAAFGRLRFKPANAQKSTGPNAHQSFPFVEIRGRSAEEDWRKGIRGKRLNSIGTRPQMDLTPVWLLLIGRSCVITCGHMPQSETLPPQSALNIVPSPAPLLKGVNISPRVHVIYERRSWVIPLEACRGWPSLWATFVKAFAERQVGRLAITHESTPLDSARWKAVQEKSSAGTIELHIVKRLDQMASDSMSILRQELASLDKKRHRPRDAIAPSDELAKRPLPGLSLFASPLLQIFQNSRLSTAKANVLHVAEDLGRLLASHRHPVVKSMYEDCRGATRNEVSEQLHHTSTQVDKTVVVRYQFVLTAHYLYSFFWPWDLEHVTTSKFWGILSNLLSLDDDGPGISTLQEANRALNRAMITAVAVTDTFCRDIDHLPALDRIPELAKAWLHFQTALTLISQPFQMLDSQDDVYDAALKHLGLVNQCLEKADELLVDLSRTVQIREHEVCQASGLFCLLMTGLSCDDLGEGTDVIHMYHGVLESMKPVLQRRRASRQVQDELSAVLDEIECLQLINSLRSDILQDALHAEGLGVDFDSRKVVPRLGGRDRRLRLFDEALAQCRIRRDALEGLRSRAYRLMDHQERRRNLKKDKQETAIYIFTIVTVIFLPLSFVSSIFGMNTSDIRNLGASQWIYWAVAIPVTTTVVCVCLLLAGILRIPGGTFSDADSSYQSEPSWDVRARSMLPASTNFGAYEASMPSRLHDEYVSIGPHRDFSDVGDRDDDIVPDWATHSLSIPKV